MDVTRVCNWCICVTDDGGNTMSETPISWSFMPAGFTHIRVRLRSLVKPQLLTCLCGLTHSRLEPDARLQPGVAPARAVPRGRLPLQTAFQATKGRNTPPWRARRLWAHAGVGFVERRRWRGDCQPHAPLSDKARDRG